MYPTIDSEGTSLLQQRRDKLRRVTQQVNRPAQPANMAEPTAHVPFEHGQLERRYAIAKQYNEQGVCVFDKDQRLVLANEQYARIYGLNPEQIAVGMSLREILTLRIEMGIYGSNGAAAYKREWMRNVVQRRTRIQDLTDGRCILVVQQPTADGHWIATHEDITERLRAEARVTFLATRDPLTGLANRAALIAKLTEALNHIAPADHLSVMMIDLDHFKPVNDTYGHDVGDEVLRIAAARIRCHVRDMDTVARLGGDEFVVVQTAIRNTLQVPARTKRLISALSQPFVTPVGHVNIGASAGIAMTNAGCATPETILKAADIALYTAKNAGRGTYHINDLSPDDSATIPTRHFSNEPNKASPQ